MPTVKERYKSATDYVRRAIAAVEGPPITPNTWEATIDAYAGVIKTQPVREELARIDAKWARASSDNERTKIARDAELLADRTKENLPGAPQDWKRTNLVKDEREHSTPATTYQQEFNKQAGETWGWLKHTTEATGSGASHLAKWLLVGGGVLLGIKTVGYLRRRERVRNRRASSATWRTLDSALEEAAESSSPGRGLARSRNAAPPPDDDDTLDNVRAWMVTSTPPPDTDAHYQREWVRGYERMAKEAMAALSNRGVISSTEDIKAWRLAALRRLRWDNTTAGQGAGAFLDALASYKSPPTVSGSTKKAAGVTKSDKSKPPTRPTAPKAKERTASSNSVASVIRDQLGPITLAMLGASDLVASDDSFQFAIKGSRKVSKIRIVLAANDTYVVEFWNGRAAKLEKVAELHDVHVEQLHDVIESQTGLSTRMRNQ